MKIIPKETYQLYSALPISEIEGRLSDFFEKEPYKIFWNGNVGNNTSLLKSFDVSVSHPFPFFGYKARIQGELKHIGEGKTELSLIAEMDKNTKRLFFIWLCIMLFFVTISLPIVIMEFIYMESQIWTMIPILLFVIGYWAVSFIFYRKSRNLKGRLIMLLN